MAGWSSMKFAIVYWIAWILIFQVCRIFFLLYNFHPANNFPIVSLLKTFLFGLKMDMSMSSYLSLPVILCLLLGIVIPLFRRRVIYKYYSAIILVPVVLIVFCDLPVFKAWGNRLDGGALRYLSSPAEAWASVSNLPVFWILLFVVIVYVLFFRFLNKVISNFTATQTVTNTRSLKQRSLTGLGLLLLAGVQVVALRGGFQLAPLNQSSVYFSKDHFLNLASVNVNWNFMYSLTKNAASTTNPFAYLPQDEATALSKSLLQSTGETRSVLDSAANPQPNVIIIIWESGIQKGEQLAAQGIPVMPMINQLKSEAISFENFFCSGDRTDKGIVAVLSGYPAQPTTSIIKSPGKAAKLPTLPSLFDKHGYQTSFYYGGELEFANMKSYLLGSGFRDFTSKDDFDEKDQNSKWGAHDDVVKDKILRDLDQPKEPFFVTWLTLTSHEPFETPVPAVISGTSNESRYYNSLHYTDSVIYSFVQSCKKQPWWKNTMLVITSDHGHRLPQTGKQLDDFRVPLLLLGGAVKDKGVKIAEVGSQTDIAATVAKQMRFDNPFTWSKDLFSQASSRWAYFCFNNAFGFVYPDGYYLYDNVGKRLIENGGQPDSIRLKQGMSLQQETFADFLHR